MKDASITVPITQSLKAKLEALARSADQTPETQARRLIEDGLRCFETRPDAPGFGRAPIPSAGNSAGKSCMLPA